MCHIRPTAAHHFTALQASRRHLQLKVVDQVVVFVQGLVVWGMKREVCAERFSQHSRTDLTESVYKVVLQKSTPPQIRQLILYYYKHTEYVDGFEWELTFVKRLCKHAW